MASDITISSLTTVAGVGQIAVTVLATPPAGLSCLSYMQPASVRIYSSATNNFNTAALIGTVNSGAGVLLHDGLGDAVVTRYYWAIPLDPEGNTGVRYPASGGVSATTKAPVPDGSVTEPKLANGAVTPTKMSVSQLSAISANIGNITAGTVTGITFTGGLFRTAVSGRRVEMDGTDNYIKIYNASGALVATLGELGALNALFSVSRSAAADNVIVSNTNVSGTAARFTGRMMIAVPGGSAFNTHLLEIANPYTTASAHAARLTNSGSGGGHLICGMSSGGGGWAAYAQSGAYGPFTAAHPGMLLKDDPAQPGDILVDVKVLARGGISDTLTEVALATEDAQVGVIGVLSSRVPYTEGIPLNVLTGPVFQEHMTRKYDYGVVNGIGEGQVNVCGLGGDISKGDYIVASSLPGKGRRLDPDTVLTARIKATIVARAREDVTFARPTDVKLVSCIYGCG